LKTRNERSPGPPLAAGAAFLLRRALQKALDGANPPIDLQLTQAPAMQLSPKKK
jgi:hypothetical protein